MAEFNSSLLREKFVIKDVTASSFDEEAKPVIALSNRLTLPLESHNGAHSEYFVVRAQNMHTCARMGARIAQEFQETGPLINRPKPFDWVVAYLTITKGYEKKFNPNRWVAVYYKGRIVFQEGEHHPFLDIIEQCDSLNKGDYEKSIKLAEDAFKKAGKTVTIEHDANIALIVSITDEEGKCGIIVRGPDRTTTFNFTARKKAGRSVKVSQCLSVAAAFLEGIQLTFQVGLTRQKLKYELIGKVSEEAKKGEESSKKLGRLNGAIQQFENMLDVRYRPDRPDFGKMIDEGELFARKVLAPQIDAKMKEDGGEWVE